MRHEHRVLSRLGNRLPYHRGASERFDRLVVARKSWGFSFVAKVAIGDRPDIRAR